MSEALSLIALLSAFVLCCHYWHPITGGETPQKTQRKTMRKMNNFAKLFEDPKLGQILVVKDQFDDDTPGLTISLNTSEEYDNRLSMSISCIGHSHRDRLFNEITLGRVVDMITQMPEIKKLYELGATSK